MLTATGTGSSGDIYLQRLNHLTNYWMINNERRMNHYDFGDPQTLLPVPPAGWHLWFRGKWLQSRWSSGNTTTLHLAPSSGQVSICPVLWFVLLLFIFTASSSAVDSCFLNFSYGTSFLEKKKNDMWFRKQKHTGTHLQSGYWKIHWSLFHRP